MADTASSCSSSSEKYDVFLSFRGKDTRRNFISHLYTALCQKQIKTFKDDRTLKKGDEVWPAIVRAINNSYLCIVVFSKHYAFSMWCLKELTQILECKQEGEIIPVFYEIEPSHIRKQSGSYKEAFEKQQKESKFNEETVRRWKTSLEKAANFSGWDSKSKDYSNESKLIDMIVKEVLRKLSYKYPSNELRGLIGIEKNVTYVESLLQKVQIIGIWGMGGIGKTTVAKVVFDKLSLQYDGCCFLANVREESEKHGLNHLRDYLLYKLLDEEDTPKVGTSFIMSRLKRKKLFIVLDDVTASEQLEYLVGDFHYLRSYSRLVVTTRDKQVLISKGIQEIFEINKVNFEESLKIFNMNAFDQNHSKIGFEELTRNVVVYAGGIPLALKVLGSSFHSKRREIWESALRRLEKCPNMKIQNVLRLSYDGLDYIEKKIFLDIACFFKGERIDRVISLLDACDFFAAVGIETLLDRALITINNCEMIEMHDLIQEMGKEIVREESINEPGRRSRLWDPEEIYDVLHHNKESHLIEGIILDLSKSKDLHLNADVFTKMINLRFLKFHTPWHEKSCKVYIPSHIEFIFQKLSYFYWDVCPLPSLSSTFCSKKLVELHMPNSHVEKLWDGVQDIVNLKKIDLSGSKKLIEVPNLSNSPNLEWVDLYNCENLCQVHPSILCLPKLVNLVLGWCIKLKSLSSETHSKSLQYLDVEGCLSLKEFSLSSEKITQVDLYMTAIEILPSSIGSCSNLKQLYIWGSLKNLPNELSNLRSLQELVIHNCRELKIGNLHIILDGLQYLQELELNGCKLSHFPDNLGTLSRLEILTLDGSIVESLPASITNLSQLRTLSLRDCRRLRHLPKLPPSIELLKANNCTSLETICTSMELEVGPCQMDFVNCVKLNQDSLLHVQAYLNLRIKRVATSTFHFCRIEACFPGNKIPRCFLSGTMQRWITIKIPSRSSLLGFAFCIIISPDKMPPDSLSCTIHCKYHFENGKIIKCLSKYSIYPKFSFDPINARLISDHVCLLYEPYNCKAILREIDEKAYNQHTNFNPKVFFEFSLFVENGIMIKQMDHMIKKCGVWPMYQSEDFISSLIKKEQSLDLGMGNKIKRCRGMDDQPTKKCKAFNGSEAGH